MVNLYTNYSLIKYVVRKDQYKDMTKINIACMQLIQISYTPKEIVEFNLPNEKGWFRQRNKYGVLVW